MPAPLAKGIIIAATIIVAAGMAAYENPQVRELFDKSRRRIALVLHTLGDEINPPQRRISRSDQLEPEELQRSEISSRNSRQSKEDEKKIADSASSFDDFLKQDAERRGLFTVHNSSIARHDNDEGLRRRTEVSRGIEKGVLHANPFVDPIGEEEASQVLFDAALMGPSHEEIINDEKVDTFFPIVEVETRESTATLSPAEEKPEISPAEVATTPTSPRIDLSASVEAQAPPFQPSAYWSVVHEWTENTPTNIDHTTNDTTAGGDIPVAHPVSSYFSIAELNPGDGSINEDIDMMSVGYSNVDSWTDVGSEVSDGDHGDHGI